MSCKCKFKNCALWGNGVCVSQNTVPCKIVPDQFLIGRYDSCPICGGYIKIVNDQQYFLPCDSCFK